MKQPQILNEKKATESSTRCIQQAQVVGSVKVRAYLQIISVFIGDELMVVATCYGPGPSIPLEIFKMK